MPRLSIIVPHCGDDSQLESTLVSILENIPDDTEVIVAHDGSYADPYELQDEVVFVEADSTGSQTALLNAALMASCSPYLNVVIPGVEVACNWTDEAMRQFEDPSVASSAIEMRTDLGSSFGLIASTRATVSKLQSGLVYQQRSITQLSGPAIQCGFYRRKPMLMIGGWNERLDLATADVELAWIMQTLGLNCIGVEFQGVFDNSGTSRTRSNTLQQLAAISVAFGISPSGIVAAVGIFLLVSLRCRFSTALAWSQGLIDRPTTRSIAHRLQHAENELQKASMENEARARQYPSHLTMRRAA